VQGIVEDLQLRLGCHSHWPAAQRCFFSSLEEPWPAVLRGRQQSPTPIQVVGRDMFMPHALLRIELV